jgi:putative alpha-1,2-mannosidase
MTKLIHFWPQSVKLNDKKLDRLYVMHSEIENGATLEWEMGSAPSEWVKGFRYALFSSIRNSRTNIR